MEMEEFLRYVMWIALFVLLLAGMTFGILKVLGIM